ncbi:tRNA (adenosine(37)-N6)-dimethylallyltransferase MiaA [Patescibacteria group bacterium]
MKYHITTYGCQANEADSERIESRLQAMSHKKTSDKKKADLIVINACSVRQSAIDRVLGEIKKHKNKKIILAGCILKADKHKFKNLVDEIWHPDEYFDLKPIYSNKDTAFVPIMTGCNNFCSYCAVPFTRGPERSRPAKEIIKEVKILINPLAGGKYKEIWLLGQNVNSYHSFPKLLKKINALPGKFEIHFMSPHPKDFSDELIKVIAKSKNVAKEIHLPVQSGNNKILKKMNRNYTREQYIRLVNKIRKAMPDIKISTDVIVGFPSETKKQFQNTVDLFKKIKFDKAYISKYSPRTETTAAITMKDTVPSKEKKQRWQILEKIINSKQKVIVILGPTASGKSDLAVEIARKFSARGGSALGGNGMEIISADSRQIYKGMDIGTGKITKTEMKGIKHYLLDVANPRKIFTAMDFKEKAEKAIKEITKKEKIPIICGGTGFYIRALLNGQVIPKIKPDWQLRKKLEKKTSEQLFKMLEKLNPGRAKNIDSKNKRRLIRAIEIAKCGKSDFPQKSDFDVLWLGIKKDSKELKKFINKRVDKMINPPRQLAGGGGLEKEVKKLVKKHGWTKVLKNTIGYQEWLDKNPVENIKTHSIQYAKRQMTWFKKYAPETKWMRNKKEIFKLVKNFLT